MWISLFRHHPANAVTGVHSIRKKNNNPGLGFKSEIFGLVTSYITCLNIVRQILGLVWEFGEEGREGLEKKMKDERYHG